MANLTVTMLREEGTEARWHIIMSGIMFVVTPLLVVQRHIIRAFTFTSLRESLDQSSM